MVSAPITVVTTMLILLHVVFFVILLMYFFAKINRQGKQLHAQFLQGTWERQGRTATGEAWQIVYHFEAATFRIEAHPNLNVKGAYRIIKEVENLLTLECFKVVTDGDWKPRHLKVAVDKRANQITIEGRIYTRLD